MGKIVGSGFGEGRGVIEGFEIEKLGCDGVEELGMKEGGDGIEEGNEEMEEGKGKTEDYVG